MLELRYRSPLEGNEDSDDGLDEDEEEEFIPNVGLVSRHRAKNLEENDGHALVSLQENIAKLEQSILSNNHSNPHVTFAGSGEKLRRSSSLNEENNDFFQKKKRTFNFPTVSKKR